MELRTNQLRFKGEGMKTAKVEPRVLSITRVLLVWLRILVSLGRVRKAQS